MQQIFSCNDLINIKKITAFFVKLRDLVSLWQKKQAE